MVSVVELYNSTMQLLKTGTSGYTNQDEWNAVLASIQKELPEYLFPYYEINTQVQDALGFLVTSGSESVTSAGLTKPDDYLHFIGASIGGKPVYPKKANQRAITNILTIRQPSDANELYYYYMEDDKIKFLPSTTHTVDYTYLREPAEASIVLTVESSEDDDFITPTAGADLEWPSTMFNLIKWMMLGQLGFELKDQLAIEYSNIGIQKEAIKP